MKGKVVYIGIGRVGLMFGKIMDDNEHEYYFDERSLNNLTMNDFQTGTFVTFEISEQKPNTAINVVKLTKDSSFSISTDNRKKLFKNVMGWSIEATEEDANLFCVPSELDLIKSGNVSYVIGRKGTGKSAIVKNIAASNLDTSRSVVLSFKDFPFNLLYECADKDFVQPNQYISVWQYIIYHKLGTLILESEKIDHATQNRLKNLLIPVDDRINRLMKRINEISLGVTVLGTGFNFGVNKSPLAITWTEQMDLLKETISNLSLTKKYFVLFDELDEDYKVFEDQKEKNTYLSMLTSLFKAVRYIRRHLKKHSNQILPIVFLRTDIYKQIVDSDKNKWNEHLVELEWNTDKIKQIFAFRIFKSYNDTAEVPESLDFDVEFSKIFKDRYVNCGNRGGKKLSTFAYITRSTQWRPRDYIEYIKICVSSAFDHNMQTVTADMVKAADDKFSEYLKQEIVDEIFPVIPQIKETLTVLSIIRKQTFNPQIFIEEYQKEVKNGNIEDKGAENILKILFEYNIIGNQPSMKGQQVFKYIFPDAKFNLKENMCIHRGLFKALQIF